MKQQINNMELVNYVGGVVSGNAPAGDVANGTKFNFLNDYGMEVAHLASSGIGGPQYISNFASTYLPLIAHTIPGAN